MSAVDKMFIAGENALLTSGHRDRFEILTGSLGGVQFWGRLDTEIANDPDAPLGSDPRMVSVLRILSPAPALVANDVVSCETIRWLIVELVEDQAGNITTDYRVNKLI